MDNRVSSTAVIHPNAMYPNFLYAKDNLQGSVVEKKARIGANYTILPGVCLGSNSLIGAGSVVIKNVLEKTVVAGNPAKFIKTIDALPY